ncbi:MAG: DUF1289 domain-containing protein [Colwellia sp.]|uniref:DUF1289 domain-containing protein n=1 Tax=Colwellia sp. TaxID=56799 RepID=UPI0025BA2BEC|nr:DUF1289 domain-containing protein [Colwellia sp.]NQZ27209.1 DUF1289 domain-containing protein [Colwellia sp.]
MNSNKKISLTNSPCVRNCCLDGDDICLGCFRHIDEIVAWRSYSEQDKLQVATLCQQRRENSEDNS